MPLRFLFILLSSFVVSQAFSQGLPLGQWRTHFGYNGLKFLALTPDKAYAAARVGIFSYDYATKELEGLSALNGLTDVAVSAMTYDPETGTLIIGYESGNIDLVKGGRVTPLDAILRAAITGSKQINRIDVHARRAYLSCDFGLVELDLVRQQVRSSNQNLGPTVRVLGAAVLKDTLYLATTAGIRYAPRDANLNDARIFVSLGFGASGLPDGELFKAINAFAGKLVVGFSSVGFFELKSSRDFFERAGSLEGNNLISSTVAGDSILVSYLDRVVVGDATFQPIRTIYDSSTITLPNLAGRAPNGDIFITDDGAGLLRYPNGGNQGIPLKPNGPNFDLPQRILAYGDKLFSLSGGYRPNLVTPLLRKQGYAIFENNEWTSYAPYIGNFPDVADVISVTPSPEGGLIFSTMGAGIIRKKPDGEYVFYNDTTRLRDGNNLESPRPADSGQYVRCTDAQFDRQGNLWITNLTVPITHELKQWGADNVWRQFKAANDQDLGGRFNGDQILIDEANRKWLRVVAGRGPDASVFCYDTDNNKTGYLSTAASNGALPSTSVFDMAFDLDGSLWLATGKGIAVLYNPSDVVSGQPFQATLPIFDGRPLLENDVVTVLVIDPGGRKWMGTRANGVWLFDAQLSRALAHFTKENAPLPSDNIQDMALVPKTGEMFISTDQGVVSYKADVTVAEKASACLVAPNPVRPGFTGSIGISGLPQNSLVKITDAAGRLMYETRSAGGTATWNGSDYTGRPATPGMYIVLATSEGATDGVVCKIALVK